MNLNPKLHHRICVLGNSASGKTTLSKKIAFNLGLPVYHIDSIQFDSNLQIRPLELIREELKKIEQEPEWIIDGFGPLDMLEERFNRADLIIYLDRSYLYCLTMLSYRFFKNLFWPRLELPIGASEFNVSHIKKSYKTIRSVHYKMLPELLKMIQKKQFVKKVQII